MNKQNFTSLISNIFASEKQNGFDYDHTFETDSQLYVMMWNNNCARRDREIKILLMQALFDNVNEIILEFIDSNQYDVNKLILEIESRNPGYFE